MTQYLMGGKEKIKKTEAEENDKTQFSIRLPDVLLEQIHARMKVSKRSRNKEIEMMLERQIESEVERDKEIIRRMADNSTLKNNQF